MTLEATPGTSPETMPPETTPLWGGEELAQAMSARVVGALPAAIHGVSIDTRTIQPGEAFFAISGLARDGHAFVAKALDAGAVAVIDEAHAAELAPLVAERGALLIVPDVLHGLEAAGRASRARTRARIVAVTGSVGKTSTKEALRLALSCQGVTHASVASYNNHWGVPLTLARMPRESQYGVFEIGMNAPGEVRALAAMVRPHVAIVTTVAPVHLEFFPSVEAIADAKGEIFSGLEPGGAAVINADTPHLARLRHHAEAAGVARIVTFGEADDAGVRLTREILQADLSVVEALVHGEAATYRVGAPGHHLAINSLGVMAAVQELGADIALAGFALGRMSAPQGRGERTELAAHGGAFVLIDESYNANPASMQAAMAALGRTEPGRRGRRIAVLADMLELGEKSAALHAALAADVVAGDIDVVYAAGPMMRSLWEALPSERRGLYCDSPDDLEPHIVAAVRAGDVVMAKGSNSMGVSRIVAALKTRFPSASAPRD